MKDIPTYTKKRKKNLAGTSWFQFNHAPEREEGAKYLVTGTCYWSLHEGVGRVSFVGLLVLCFLFIGFVIMKGITSRVVQCYFLPSSLSF